MLVSHEDFSNLFRSLSGIEPSTMPHRRALYGVCWVGHEKEDLPTDPKARLAAYSGKVGPQGTLRSAKALKRGVFGRRDIDRDDGEKTRTVEVDLCRHRAGAYYHVLSPCKKMEFVSFLQCHGKGVAELCDNAFFLWAAEELCGVSIEDICGRLPYAYVFTVLQARSMKALLKSVDSFVTCVDDLSELWALCRHEINGIVSFSAFSLLDAEGEKYDSPKCLFSVDSFSFPGGSDTPPTICLFWRNPDQAPVIDGEKVKTEGARVRVTLSARHELVHP